MTIQFSCTINVFRKKQRRANEDSCRQIRKLFFRFSLKKSEDRKHIQRVTSWDAFWGTSQQNSPIGDWLLLLSMHTHTHDTYNTNLETDRPQLCQLCLKLSFFTLHNKNRCEIKEFLLFALLKVHKWHVQIWKMALPPYKPLHFWKQHEKLREGCQEFTHATQPVYTWRCCPQHIACCKILASLIKGRRRRR